MLMVKGCGEHGVNIYTGKTTIEFTHASPFVKISRLHRLVGYGRVLRGKVGWPQSGTQILTKI